MYTIEDDDEADSVLTYTAEGTDAEYFEMTLDSGTLTFRQAVELTEV